MQRIPQIKPALSLLGAMAALLVQACSGVSADVADTKGAGPRDGDVAAGSRIERPRGHSFYVSVSGSPAGDGSEAHPWDLATALAQPGAVRPGDTIWIRGGRYGDGSAEATVHSRLAGTEALPIVVRAYPGERAILDEWLQVGCCQGAADPRQGAWVWFWDLEFAGYNPDRTSGRSGPPEWSRMANHAAADTWAPGTRFINCVVHDTGGGLSLWQEDAGGEAYGNLIYHVGGQGPDRGHGHGFYVQNSSGVKRLAENIVFDNFGAGVHCYGSKNADVRDLVLEGNAVFDNGAIGNVHSASDNIIVAGGEGGAQNILLAHNFTYFRPELSGYNEMGDPWSPRNGSAVVQDNYFVGGMDALDFWRWESLRVTHNLIMNGTHPMVNVVPLQAGPSYEWDTNMYYGSGSFTLDRAGRTWEAWRGAGGMDAQSHYGGTRPHGTVVAVRANRYERGRANIIIYNWDHVPSVAVNLAGILERGESYEVRDAQNFFGAPVRKGTYQGGPVELPMTGLSAAQPNGSVSRPHVHTAPEFAAFVVRSTTQS
ncbi:MAG TPA: right-handed parallel beta-helix repeat-containing protein, partial [Bryobacteraceae bacterium]|nr:right-handed parallel beta-helix repeat-containing protein [Bryobacteraceae bacterium]